MCLCVRDGVGIFNHVLLLQWCRDGRHGASTISLTIVYSTVYSGANQRKHQSSTSLALVRRIPRWPVNSPHQWPVTLKMFPFDDVIIINRSRDLLRNYHINWTSQKPIPDSHLSCARDYSRWSHGACIIRLQIAYGFIYRNTPVRDTALGP